MRGSRRAAGWLALLVTLLGLGDAEAGDFPIQRGFQSCSVMAPAILFPSPMVLALETAAVTPLARQLVGVLVFASQPGRPAVPVSGVGRQRVTDADFDFTVSFDLDNVTLFLNGRLEAPDYASGPAKLIPVPNLGFGSLDVALQPVSCPVGYGDLP